MIHEFNLDYVYIVDYIPQQSPEHNKLYTFFNNLKANRLTTTRCPSCQRDFWPPRTVCPLCHSNSLEWVDLPPTGTVRGFSIQTSGAAPGLTLPMIFARVQLTDQVGFVARVIGVDPAEMEVGMTVEPVVVSAPRDRVMWAFRPKI